VVCEVWNDPDEGIWELRSGKLQNIHSKAMAQLALERFVLLAKKFNWKVPTKKYLAVSHEIKKQVESNGYSEKLHSYMRAYSEENLDASFLTVPILGGDWNKERSENTVIEIYKNLTYHGLTYRYLTKNDGLKGREGTFMACSFWLIEDLVKFGHKREAKDLMNQLMGRLNPLGLWPEEMDPETHEYLGNYPQAFTHTAMIGAALALKDS
jgi:GH15 family glucan-1,4-alpha-glucosidase